MFCSLLFKKYWKYINVISFEEFFLDKFFLCLLSFFSNSFYRLEDFKYRITRAS